MQQLKQDINNSLSEIYSEEEIRIFTFSILEKITGFTKTQILANRELILSKNQKIETEKIISRLKNNEPIQYILGETEFYGLKFMVNSSVLIPRPETEELIQWIKPPHPFDDFVSKSVHLSSDPQGGFLNQKNERIDFLDIGTGSGCIAISLKKLFPNATVSAMDISADALEIAKKNAKLNNVEINFIQSDILKINDLDKKYDVIVSNPPYVLESDKINMELNVLDFEPHIALFVKDDDPLVFYRKIAELAKNHLNENGLLFFEIHNKQGENCKKMLESIGFKNITLRKDISGNDRMIRCNLK